MWSLPLDTAKREMVLGWRKMLQYRPLKTVLHHHLLREMILHLLCTTFLTGWMDSTPSSVNALTHWTVVLMSWMHGLQEWIHASPSLRRMWVMFVSASTFHLHPHRFSLLLYFNLKPCIWLCFYDIILWTFGIVFSICYLVNYDWTWWLYLFARRCLWLCVSYFDDICLVVCTYIWYYALCMF